MNTTRLVVYTLLAAALAAAVALPRDSTVMARELGGVDTRMRQAVDRVTVHYEMARRHQSRSLARATADAAAGRTGLTIRPHPSVDQARAAGIDSIVRAWWLRAGTDTLGASLTVTIVVDSIVSDLGVPDASANIGRTSDVFVPPVGASPACHIVLRLPVLQRDRGESADVRGTTSVLNSCRWLLRFGPPGPGVRAWLEDRRYGALVASRPVDRPSARAGVRQPTPSLRWDYWAMRSERVRQEIGCVLGHDAACEAAVLRAWNDTWRPGSFPDGWFSTRGPIFMDETGFRVLELVHRSVGREAFLALWRGDAPFAQGVEQAMRQPLAVVVRAALQDALGASADHGIRRGPLPPASGLFAGIVLAVAGLAVGSGGFRRRRSEG